MGAHLRYPFGYDPEYLRILSFPAFPFVSETVGNRIPFIATLPKELYKFIGPGFKEGFLNSK